jgi:hypothetical protein
VVKVRDTKCKRVPDIIVVDRHWRKYYAVINPARMIINGEGKDAPGKCK